MGRIKSLIGASCTSFNMQISFVIFLGSYSSWTIRESTLMMDPSDNLLMS